MTKEIKQPQETADDRRSSVLTGYIPCLRVCISFNLDLPSLLDIFKRNPARSCPLGVKCHVEKLNG